MAYCGPGDLLIDPPDHFEGGSNPMRHRHVQIKDFFTVSEHLLAL